MKKSIGLLIIFLNIVLLITGCTSDQGGRQITKPSINSKTITMYYPRRINQTPSDQHVERWESYMFDKYDLHIDLTHINLLQDIPINKNASDTDEDTQTSGIDFDTLTELSGTSGFVFVDSYSDLTELIKRDLIMPVNFYLESLKSLKNIDDVMIESFKDSYGDIWALPLVADSLNISKRTYNKEWLDKANMPVPETIEEFYNFAEYVANEDPDGNGIDDTYILDYTDRNLFWQLEDVFRAFGCYPDKTNPIAYNPGTMKFENMILNDAFIDAMVFIKTLKDNNMIINSETAEKGYRVASSYTNSLYYEYVKDRAYGCFLRGPNENLLIEEKYSEKCMAVLKFTENPAEKIEQFYNMIFSSLNSFMDFNFGIENEDYFDMTDYYKVTLNYGDGGTIDYVGIYITLNQIDIIEKPIINTESNLSNEERQRILKAANEKRAADDGVMQYLGTNLSYRLSFDLYDNQVLEAKRNPGPTKNLVYTILEGYSTIEDAQAEYIKSIERNGSIEKLNDLNKR